MIRPAISIILAISPLLITPELPWSKSKSGGGVVVYTRPVAGSDIKEIKALADNNLIMPPKSTYIEPKFRSGLVVYEL
jgi:hypothetical protein